MVKATGGLDRPEAANQAFTVAAAAVAAGARVSLWLTGEASWFARAGTGGGPGARARHAAAPTCWTCSSRRAPSPCARSARHAAASAQTDLLPGVRIAGAAVFVEETLHPQAQALVY